MSPLVETAVLVACAAPMLLLLVLGVAALANRLQERGIGALTRAGLLVALAGALTALVTYHVAGQRPQTLRYGAWFAASEAAFSFDLAIDGLSLGFAALSILICNVVAAFSFRYLHHEQGFRRYFFQMTLFVVGITFVALAGSVEVLFVGWEFLGLSSALLVGFFQERRAPVANALRVYAVYRLSDAAMLSAAVLLHHWTGSGNLTPLFSGGLEHLGPVHALVVGLLLIVSVASKSALWPFSGWLPRAMEGPTPSSAVYYGALSIHAGCFLLLRVQPLLLASTVATVLMVIGGVITAFYGALAGRVQTDVKSAISYATLAQVGIIVVEISCGLRILPMLHITGHACFRLLQFLSAPNVLHDLHDLENRLGAAIHAPERGAARGRTSLYLFALERGFADGVLERVVGACRYLVGKLDVFDRLLVADRSRKRDRT
ncbi:MAG: proton-conducting membrane transporter [Myxococcales bacterium]|nr:proton-conducting membrane transporter [Myxococcales bacterium]